MRTAKLGNCDMNDGRIEITLAHPQQGPERKKADAAQPWSVPVPAARTRRGVVRFCFAS
jgi:hypothetical protein